MIAGRCGLEWDRLAAIEPSPGEVLTHAGTLLAAYNDPYNRAMMAGSGEMSREDVLEHFASLRDAGGRPFILFQDGALAGDADLRHVDGGRAELAILIAAREARGKGLGTRFALMLHAFAFRTLGLDRLYVTIIPENAPSLRLFEKLGYARDDSVEARAFADATTDVSLSLTRGDFERARAHALSGLRILLR